MTDDPFPGRPGAVDRIPADPGSFAAYGLAPIELEHRELFSRFFASLTRPLSDFTFSQIYTWRNSLHLSWTVLAGHLCVFANGSGDLTMLMPPVGDGNGDAAH